MRRLRFYFVAMVAMSTMSNNIPSAEESPNRRINAVSIQHIQLDTNTDYAAFLSRLDAQLGHNDPSVYQNDLGDPTKSNQIEATIKSQAGSSGFMSFAMFDFGKLVTLRGENRQARQYLIGNPLIALEMAKNDIRAGLYAPLRVLVYADDAGKARVEYDLPSSLFGQFGNADVNKVATGLDQKLSTLIDTAMKN